MGAARHPVDAVLDQTWGKRLDLRTVRAHVESTYGVRPIDVASHDGVWQLDFDTGQAWAVRVFRPERPVEAVTSDAALLRYLERHGFPAERCATPEPVSVCQDHAVLVTTFMKGKVPPASARTAAKLGDLAGRLAALSLPDPGDGLATDVGAFHHYTMDTSLAAELANARLCLESVADRVPADRVATYDLLCEAIAHAGDFADLPRGVVHPDLARVNTLSVGRATCVAIDWSGGGVGPRVAPLGWVLATNGAARGGVAADRITAIISAFSEHVRLTEVELDALDRSIAHRPLIMEAFGFAIGMRLGGPPLGFGQWSKGRDRFAETAAIARDAFAAHVVRARQSNRAG